jgi:hypothetical protein
MSSRFLSLLLLFTLSCVHAFVRCPAWGNCCLPHSTRHGCSNACLATCVCHALGRYSLSYCCDSTDSGSSWDARCVATLESYVHRCRAPYVNSSACHVPCEVPCTAAAPLYTTGVVTTGAATTGEASAEEEDLTTGELTTGEQTTGEQTTGSVTTGEQTTGEITTGEQTTGEQTTGSVTTGEQTTGEITTGEQTTGEQTTGSVTTGEQTTGSVTTGEQTTGEDTTGEQTTGSVTTGEQTTWEQTTGSVTTGEQTTGEITTGELTTGAESSPPSSSVQPDDLGEEEEGGYTAPTAVDPQGPPEVDKQLPEAGAGDDDFVKRGMDGEKQAAVLIYLSLLVLVPVVLMGVHRYLRTRSNGWYVHLTEHMKNRVTSSSGWGRRLAPRWIGLFQGEASTDSDLWASPSALEEVAQRHLDGEDVPDALKLRAHVEHTVQMDMEQTIAAHEARKKKQKGHHQH